MDPKRIPWSPEAEARLAKVPFFVRPFVRKRAQQAAADRGLPEVTAELLSELKGQEHPGAR